MRVKGSKIWPTKTTKSLEKSVVWSFVKQKFIGRSLRRIGAGSLFIKNATVKKVSDQNLYGTEK